MPAKLVKVRRGLGSGKSSLKSTAKASTESLHVENASPSKEPSSSQQQQKNAANLTSDQARAMVLDAFRSASSRLHVQNGKGILGSIAPPHNETVTKGAASGPQSPELVDITTRPGDTREKAARRQVHVAEAQKATQGLYLYLPGLGFKYQDDDNELGQ